MKIEIYDKKTNEVLEEKEVQSLKAFMFYWAVQCNTKDFSWRILK